MWYNLSNCFVKKGWGMLREGYYETKIEYTKEYKISCWDAAIGLQQVDGLEVSDYLRDLSNKEIDGELTHYEIEELLYKLWQESQGLHQPFGRCMPLGREIPEQLRYLYRNI